MGNRYAGSGSREPITPPEGPKSDYERIAQGESTASVVMSNLQRAANRFHNEKVRDFEARNAKFAPVGAPDTRKYIKLSKAAREGLGRMLVWANHHDGHAPDIIAARDWLTYQLSKGGK